MKAIIIAAFFAVASAMPQWGGPGYAPQYAPQYAPGGYGGYGGYAPQPMGGGGWNQGVNNMGAIHGAGLNQQAAQGSQGSALHAGNSQFGAAEQDQFSGLAARNAGSSNSYGNKFGKSETFGESYGSNSAHDNSLQAAQGSHNAGMYGANSHLDAVQGSQGSQNALNANQFGAQNANNAFGNGYGYYG